MVSGENIVSITANDQAIRKALIAILNGTVAEQVATYVLNKKSFQ